MKMQPKSEINFLLIVRAILRIIGATIFISMLASPVFAKNKKVSGSTEGMYQLAVCRSMIDPNNPKDQSSNDRIANSCCSKEYGYCIECPKATPNECTKYPYRLISRTPTAPKGDVLAPEDATPKSRLPRLNNSTGTVAN